MMKHLVLLCGPAVCEYEVIPPSTLREACAKGRQDLDRQLSGDVQNVWTQPLTPGEAMSKFKLSKAMLMRAATLKAKGAKAMEARAMPATLGDKVLSAFLKNGQALCGAFQIGRCAKEEDQCGALHKSAVVLKSARVCGGRHAASECRDKRALPIGGTQPPQTPVADPAPEEGRPPKVAQSPRGDHLPNEGYHCRWWQTMLLTRPSSTDWQPRRAKQPRGRHVLVNTCLEARCGFPDFQPQGRCQPFQK